MCAERPSTILHCVLLLRLLSFPRPASGSLFSLWHYPTLHAPHISYYILVACHHHHRNENQSGCALCRVIAKCLINQSSVNNFAFHGICQCRMHAKREREWVGGSGVVDDVDDESHPSNHPSHSNTLSDAPSWAVAHLLMMAS